MVHDSPVRNLAPWLAALALISITSCAGVPPVDPASDSLDVHSFAQPDRVRVHHLELDVVLDFTAKRVEGKATLHLERQDPAAPLRLDTQDLEILTVLGPDGGVRRHSLGASGPFGAPLTVHLLADDRWVEVSYRTDPNAAALQWLDAEQTDAGTGPFLYTQGQAILTRSWIPLQDTPGVRMSFDARVFAPEEMTVVMGAQALPHSPGAPWRFRMSQAIPSYLIAMACGTLAFQPVGARCGVWAEPTIVEAAAAELEDMDDMVRVCETLFGPYRWQRFDVIVLPPAFPFGGMENPRLTFATPTILAGDKSLVALIAHELAHSWSGNLVTNATWRDFWLNEGFTVYLEQRIMEALYGRERAEMEILLGMKGLDDELAELPPKDQVLHIDLTGRNPDDGMTAVPYDKGAAFLRRLEAHFGRERLDKFLSGYFDAHAFQSITTAQFLRYLREHLLGESDDLWAELGIEEWIHQPGLPSSALRPHSVAFDQVDVARRNWLEGKPARTLHTDAWITHQWLHFLAGIPDDVGPPALTELDQAFGFTQTRNSEILAAWLELAIRHRYAPADQRLEAFLLEVGRRKFLKPLYEEMALTQNGLLRARMIYEQARPRYHAVARRTLDQILGWDG